LTKRWGAFVANDGVSVELPPGARHALIGPNGAGKTTLVNLLTGLYPPTSGEVFLGAERITTLPQHRRVARGITRTFQVNCLFPELSVLESVMLAVCQRRGGAGVWFRTLRSRSAEQAEAWSLLESVRLGDEANALTRNLSYGKQRLLELGLALATRPRILLLDEPACGIPAADSSEMFQVLAKLPEDVSVLFIEHDMDLVFRFAQRISVLCAGKILAEGSPESIARNSQVKEVYLGGAGAPAAESA
jgi:branched-chain amino acid transport system ATP-binding protein